MRFRTLWYFGVLVALVRGVLIPASTAAASPLNTPFVADELVVRLSSSVDAQAFALNSGLSTEAGAIEQLGTQPIYRFHIVDGETPRGKALKLLFDPQVLYAEPNYLGQLPEARLRSTWVVGGDTHDYQSQYAAEKMRLPEAHSTTRGDGVTVAVLDTGVDVRHPDLANRLVDGYDFVDHDADPSEAGIADVDIAYGHGTHVAGLIALAAPAAQIMPLRTLDRDGIGTIWTQVEALRYAVDHGADVINLSYSFPVRSLVLADVLSRITCSRRAEAICQRPERPGVVVVAAAGNSGAAIREYPAAERAPGILAVGATTETDTLTPFSTYGAWVSVAAPGDRILSTIPGGGYATWSGTSMAAPLAAGTIALVRASSPALRPAAAVTRLKTTATALDATIGRRVDAAAALAPPAQ
jgi:subtilisin family serine protease